MSKNNENYRALAGVAGVGACLAWPITAASVLVGGYVGYKVSDKIAQKVYGPRDVGGVFPAAALVLSMTFASAGLATYGAHTALEKLKEAEAQQTTSQPVVQVSPAYNHQLT
ncbi:MAG: hypothetical protein NZ828_11190 [Alphaproteobacteria bacterium]|nr:hypothetical protein [Alphaproteobacteria bacterium]